MTGTRNRTKPPAPEERRRRIVDRLAGGGVSVRALGRLLGASDITIRRDLAALARDGKLLRVHGGAIPNERVAYEFSFHEKEQRNRKAKEAIARAAADLVAPGAAVFVDTGTTALAVARALRAARPSVIVTVNLCVASAYVGQRDVPVLVPGGRLSPLSPDLYGEWALRTLADLTVDVAFLGCDTVDPAAGFFAAETRSAAVSRTMLKQSGKAYVLADASKFGRRALCRIATLDRVAGVVSDFALEARHRRALKRAGCALVLGGRGGSRTPAGAR